MKIDMNLMNMVAGWKAAGDLIIAEQMPMYGGYSGGIEETAICDVAATLASFTLLGSDIHLDGPVHIRWGNTTARETLQIAAHAAAAVDLNTDLLLADQYYTLGGPCTEMCLLETAAQAVTDTVSGRDLLSGVASSKGVVKDHSTGMEARMMGEAAIASEGMDIERANRVIDNIVSLYENSFSRPPAGKRFQDCYDVDSVTPSKEYLKIYDKAVETLGKCGLNI
jgi:methylamine--corrinoid protein Co-methyltransferase